MTRGKKTGLWFVGAVTVAAILLLSLHFLLARPFLREEIKARLLERVCPAGDCQVTFGRLEILLLPAPHVAASNVQIELPGMLSGTIASLSITPKFLPLFSGRVELAGIQLTAPRMVITIPNDPATVPRTEASPAVADPSSSPTASLTQLPGLSTPDSSRLPEEQAYVLAMAHLGARFLSVVGELAEKAPGLHLRIKNGDFSLTHKTHSLIQLRELSAEVSLPPHLLTVRLECRSDFWGKFALTGRADLVEGKSMGQLSIDRFQSQLLGEYLPANVLKPVGESPLNFDASFSGEGSGRFHATFQASSPSLTLQVGDDRAVISKATLEGRLQREANKLEITVAGLHVDDPQLDLTGQFRSDLESSDMAYQVECRNTNATAIREVALALVGESQDVQDIFAIIRGGHVPLATFEARGRSAAELKQSRALVVKGRLEKGEVFIPNIKLNISEVVGDVLISQGILEGTNLEGKAERSLGRKGSLTVALAGKEGPFHLDIEIDADLAQLPPVLARVVDNRAFLRELALVQDVTGTARGRLLLGGTLNSIKTRVEVAEWKLKGQYERMPFPLELEAGALVYEGPELTVEGLQGHIGRSEVRDLSGSLTWSHEPKLELVSPAKGHLHLGELFPWLMTFPSVNANRWQIQTLEGALRVDSLTFKGPLTKPENWRFALTGRLDNVASLSSLLGNPLKIRSGALSLSHQNLETTSWELVFLDASLVVSGKLTGFSAERPSADFTFQGTVGPQAGEWVSNLVELPAELRARTAVAIPRSRLTLDRSGRTTFSSILRIGESTELALDLDRAGKESFLGQLRVEDQESNATITVNLKPGESGFGFQGNLVSGTLDRILAENGFFKGSMTGDFTAHFFHDRLADSTADGRLALRDFRYGPVPGTTMRVEDALFEARGQTLEIKKALIRLQDEPLELKGTVNARQDQLQLDLGLVAQGIDWNKLKATDLLEHLSTTRPGRAPADGTTFLGTPVRGALRIQADHFAFANFTWKPFKATLVFAPDGLNLEVTDANLCSISTPARLISHPQGTLLIINPAARKQELDPTLTCLWDRKGVITGSFDLAGEITANVQPEKMSETFRGKLNLEARDGRVYRSTVLAKIFALLNVTEIYRGKLPDLVQEGCAYDSLKARTTLKNGKVLFEDVVFDGHCAKLVGTGAIDLASLQVDFTVLVSPFKTVDTVIRQVPLLGRALGGTLVTIPLKVTGDLTDPSVVPLSPTAVGSGLLNTMKNVFQLPFTLTQPLQ